MTFLKNLLGTDKARVNTKAPLTELSASDLSAVSGGLQIIMHATNTSNMGSWNNVPALRPNTPWVAPHHR